MLSYYHTVQHPDMTLLVLKGKECSLIIHRSLGAGNE